MTLTPRDDRAPRADGATDANEPRIVTREDGTETVLKTKDGVSLIYGNKYSLWRITSKSREVITEEGTVTQYDQLRVNTHGLYYVPISFCYSTRRAALEAALKQEMVAA